MCGRMTLLAVVLFSMVQTPSRLQAEDRFFMMVFASQGEPNLPRFAHTFATFIKVAGAGPLDKRKIEEHTISWLPASLLIEPLRRLPEPGKNLDLKASIAYAHSLNTTVAGWGPFPIKSEHYERACKQIDFLQSGKMSYIVMDRRFRGQGASNCIHAVTDVERDKGFLDTGTAHGIMAGQLVLSHFEPWVIPTREDLTWLTDRLGLPKGTVQPLPVNKEPVRLP